MQGEIQTKLASEPALSATLHSVSGRFWFGINGRDYFPWLIALPSDPFTDSAQTYIREYSRAGFHLVELPIRSTHFIKGAYSDVRPSEELAFDFDNEEAPGPGSIPGALSVSRRLAAVLSADPEARILIRLDIGNVPKWWRSAYSNEFIQFQDGTRLIGPAYGLEWYYTQPSLSSELWVRYAQKVLDAFVAYVEHSPYSRRVFAYCLNYGESYERFWNGWGARGPKGPMLLDYSESTRKLFGAYLAKTYSHNLEEFRRAWGEESATFKDVKVPSELRRMGKGPLDFAVDADHRASLDYYRFLASRNEDLIEEFISIARRHTGTQKLLGTPGSYWLAHTASQYQQSGHPAAVPRLLQAGQIDFVAAPNSLFDRGIGGVTYSCAMLDSFSEHGKLTIAEEDFLTPKVKRQVQGLMEGVNDWPGCIESMTRNALYGFMKGHGFWWLDLGGDGAYLHEPLIARAKKLLEIFEQEKQEAGESKAQMALIVDPEAVNHVRSSSTLLRCLEIFQMTEISRIGAPYDYYHLMDLEKAAGKKYRFYMMLGTFDLAPAQRALLKEIQASGATVLWFYGSGIYDNDQLSEKMAEENIGQKIGIIATAKPLRGKMTASPWADVTNGFLFGGGDRPLTWIEKKRIEPPYPYPECGPIFFSKDSGAKILASLNGTNLGCLSVKSVGSGRSVFCGTYTVPSSILRNLASESGVHIFSRGDDFILDSTTHLFAAFSKAGTNTIEVPQGVKTLNDLLSGRGYGAQNGRVEIECPYGERVFLFTKK